MPKYLTLHEESQVDRILLESRWTELSNDTRAEWVMTLFNTELGLRYCEWDAPNRQAIERIFTDLGIKWTEIIEVEVTRPSDWRLYRPVRGIERLPVSHGGKVRKEDTDHVSPTSGHMLG
jgi:Nickel responsive protein SCO4226-like